MVTLAPERGDVVVLVQQQQLELGGGAEGGGAIVPGLNVECVVLLLLTVQELRGADNARVTVDGEATSVVVS